MQRLFMNSLCNHATLSLGTISRQLVAENCSLKLNYRKLQLLFEHDFFNHQEQYNYISSRRDHHVVISPSHPSSCNSGGKEFMSSRFTDHTEQQWKSFVLFIDCFPIVLYCSPLLSAGNLRHL